MSLVLKDADLSRHVRDAGYWHRPVGTVISGTSGVKVPKGKHLTLQTETDRYSVDEQDPTALAAKVAELVKHAQSTSEGSTEWENAWASPAIASSSPTSFSTRSRSGASSVAATVGTSLESSSPRKIASVKPTSASSTPRRTPPTSCPR